MYEALLILLWFGPSIWGVAYMELHGTGGRPPLAMRVRMGAGCLLLGPLLPIIQVQCLHNLYLSLLDNAE